MRRVVNVHNYKELEMQKVVNIIIEGAIMILVTFSNVHSVKQANHHSLYWRVKDGPS